MKKLNNISQISSCKELVVLLEDRLTSYEEFLLDCDLDKSFLPKLIRIKDKNYFRYMDRIFSPKPINDLTPTQSKYLCELRLRVFDHVVTKKLNNTVIEQFINIIQSKNQQQQILDFGCGNGYFTANYKIHFPEAKITGVDISNVAIKAAKKNKEIKFIWISGDNSLPFENDYFSAIVSSFVMHFKIDLTLVNELYRVLRPGGSFIFNIYNEQYLKQDFFEHLRSKFALRSLANSNLPKHHISFLATKFCSSTLSSWECAAGTATRPVNAIKE